MALDQTQPGYTDAAAADIAEFGGKMGGLAYLKRQGGRLADAVLPYQIVKPGEAWTGPTVDAGEFGRYIVRGSHPNDFQGLVDVLPTRMSPTTEGIGTVIDAIRERAASAEVITYGRSENPSYDGRVIVGVQPYAAHRTGSIVEHPNQPGVYVISYVNRNSSNKSGRDIQTAMYTPATNRMEWLSGQRIGEQRAQAVTEMYRLVERSGLVRDDLSFQMEFLDNYHSVFVAQVRAFTASASPTSRSRVPTGSCSA